MGITGMIAYFSSVEVTLSAKLLELVFMLMGVVTFYITFKTIRQKDHPSKAGTAVFWLLLSVLLAFGRFIPNLWNGILIVIMSIPSILKMVKKGTAHIATPEQKEKMANKIGPKLFLPAFMMGLCSIMFALFTQISPLVGVALGVFIAMILVSIFSPDTKPKMFFDDASRMMEIVGPVSLLPMLLAALGAIFTSAGVGPVVSDIVSVIIPEGNIVIGVIVYAVGMAVFTMIMGNAFAAITVMTVGIGAPFVLAYGLDPNIVGMLALTCGYCGTLCTPMAANFNIVPVAVLEMKDKNTVIKNQYVVAGIMLVVQIIYILVLA